MPTTGRCLCGAVKITLDGDLPEAITACHCTDCQHTSGSAFSCNILVPVEAVHFNGTVSNYDSPASSGNTVTRVFCTQCGSALAHKSKAFLPAMAVQVGNLESYANKPIEAELFVKDKYSGIPKLADTQKEAMPE